MIRAVGTLVCCLTLAVCFAPIASSTQRLSRTVGYGEIRFNGLGPERWARRYRVEHRRWLAEHTRRLRDAQAHRRALRYLSGSSDEQHLMFLVRSFLCIHGGEGSWTDTGDPYWGGVQMDRTFMGTYAPKVLLDLGWANAWTPAEQVAVSIIAYETGRGFHPWPNTARACGLL